MKIPLFKDTHEAVAFVNKNHNKKSILIALKKKRNQIEAKSDRFMEAWRHMTTKRNVDKLMKIATSAQAHREAVEIMEKMPHWKNVWGNWK